MAKGQPSCMANVFPRIQHLKVRGGQGVASPCQPSSALACLKWKAQALESGFLSSIFQPNGLTNKAQKPG